MLSETNSEAPMSSSSQSPLTFREFHASFPDEAACVDFLAKVRWPNGFRCPACSSSNAWRLACRPLWECPGIVEVDESIVGGGGKGVVRRLGPGGAWIVLAIERLEIDRGDKRYQASGSPRATVTSDTRATTLQDFVVDAGLAPELTT
jgi:hypothetical protein